MIVVPYLVTMLDRILAIPQILGAAPLSIIILCLATQLKMYEFKFPAHTNLPVSEKQYCATMKDLIVI